jgi:HK97 family phage portal protein
MTRFKRPSPKRFDSAGALDAAAKGAGEAEERGIAGEQLWWPAGGSAGVMVDENTALGYAAVLATVVVLSSDTAVLPLQICQTLPDQTRRIATEHPAHLLMSRSPNGEATPIRWKQSLMSHALQRGSGYAEIQRLGNGRPYGLHLLDPKSTEAARDAAKKLHYKLGVGYGASRSLPAENVLHIAGLGFDGISGYNFTKLLRQGIGLGIAGDTFAADFFSNGSESGGTIEVPGRLKDQDAVDRLRNRWESRHQGAGKRFRTAVLEEGAKYNPTSTDPDKSQLLQSRQFQVNDTVRPWRVPPHKIGDLSEAHLANLEASNLDYLISALMSWLVTIEQEFNLKLLSIKEWLDGYHFEHDTMALLRGDIKSRIEFYSAAIRDGWMNRNQARAREHMNPMSAEEGGEAYTVQMQVVPLAGAVKAMGDSQTATKTTPVAAATDAALEEEYAA